MILAETGTVEPHAPHGEDFGTSMGCLGDKLSRLYPGFARSEDTVFRIVDTETPFVLGVEDMGTPSLGFGPS